MECDLIGGGGGSALLVAHLVNARNSVTRTLIVEFVTLVATQYSRTAFTSSSQIALSGLSFKTIFRISQAYFLVCIVLALK